MRRRQLASLALTVCLLGLALTSKCRAGAEDTRKDFERLASQFRFFFGDDFHYYHVPEYYVPAAMLAEYKKLHDEVTAPKHETTALLALLNHKNPRVRTLAIAALSAKEDPKLLPRLVDMVGDTAVTFPDFLLLSRPFGFDRDKLPPLVECNVGELASTILQTYLDRAGCYDRLTPETRDGFDPYWAVRKDRAFCASWFRVQLDRARDDFLATPEERSKRIRAVRERIDHLPKMDRAWTLLWLQSKEMYIDALASKEDLLAACKDLGPARLMAMLQRKIPSEDPDLQPRPSNNSDYICLQHFVLAHAGSVLRPEDAPALLDCEHDERDYLKHRITDPYISPWWAIAAASLQPEHAKEWLREAMKRFTGEYDGDNRAALAAALCRLVGSAETEFVVNWFYEQEPQQNYYPHCRAQFLLSVASLPNRGGRKFIAAIVRDKRLEKLDWQSWRTLVEVVNGWVEKPVLLRDVVENLKSPVRLDEFYWKQEKARKEHPEETAAVLKAFAEWAAALRESIPKWGE
jgi:hypothetical protein